MKAHLIGGGGIVAIGAMLYPQVDAYYQTHEAQAIVIHINQTYEHSVSIAADTRDTAVAKAQATYKVDLARADHERDAAVAILKQKYPRAHIEVDSEDSAALASGASHEANAAAGDTAKTHS